MWRSAVVLMLVGCGVSASTPINDVDADDWVGLCAELTADSVAKSEDCGAYTANIPAYTAADCEADVAFFTAGCDAVVGDWQTCMQGTLTTDPCNPQYPSACDLVNECSSI